MEDFSKYTDTMLLELLRAGNRDAMSEIYTRYWPLLFSFVARMLEDKEAAYDLVQDVLVSLWERRQDIDIKDHLKAYLYGATRKKVLLSIRSSKVRDRYEQTLKAIWTEDSVSLEESLIERELYARFEAEMERLPQKMREAFELSRVANYSYREIAEKMNISDHTVKQHISKALKILRKRILSLLFFHL